MKTKIRKTEISLLLITGLQIFLLMNLTPAESYLVRRTNPAYGNSAVGKGNSELTDYALELLIGFVSLKQIGSVSATDLSVNCCPKTKEGAICQNILASDADKCDGAMFPTTCEESSECKIGCCNDGETGKCTTNSPKKKCESEGGNWSSEKSCLIKECVKGCCVVGNNAPFITEKECGFLSEVYGVTLDFRGELRNEFECYVLTASERKGACVGQETCRIKSERECLSENGDFHDGVLCSAPELNITCVRQVSVGCSENKNEIYWFDSCGNQENIYSSNKDISFGNGKILSKEQSCSGFSENCGNCAIDEKCLASSNNKIKDGDFTCRSLNCVDKNGKERKNGESWCVYESYIGDGKDAVGSRHWKAMCVEGEIKTEGCADYRGGICTESKMLGEKNSDEFSSANCIVNEASLCMGYNSEDKNKMKELCEANTDCMIKNIDVDSGFRFDVCVGRYPRGFDLSGDSTLSKNICSFADQTCKVVYQKDALGKWKCKQNCQCQTAGFSNQMNALCVSLGDCGSYVNYIGDGTDNVVISGAPKISWENYKNFAEPVAGQFAKPKDLREVLARLGISVEGLSEEEQANKVAGLLGSVSGGISTILMGAASLKLLTLSTTGQIISTSYFTGWTTIQTGTIATTLGAVAYAAAGAGIGAMVGGWLAKSQGISGTAATVMVVAGAVGGAALGLIASSSSLCATGYGCVITVVIAIVTIVWTLITGWGKTKIVNVSFKCQPWQAPTGGDNCEKCDDNPLYPCTKYKCDSLGKACKLLNENTENPICESIPNDGKFPVISKGEIYKSASKEISTDYKFTDEDNNKIKIRTQDDECINEFTPVLFSLKTDEYAQCKYNFQPTALYDDMGEYPVEGTIYSINHTFGFFMPSLDSFSVYNLSGNLKEMFGNMNMYVRCEDYHGNFNLAEYIINFCVHSGPDITPVLHKYTTAIPASGSYLKYGITDSNLTIYVNEPAECRYDIISGKEYGMMRNEMKCLTELEEIDDKIGGWLCSANLTGLTESENKIFIKCRDQPWLAETANESKRNDNKEDFTYVLYRTNTELKIDSITPEGTIYRGFEPISVDMEVRTSGGVENGKAVCYWGDDFLSPLFETNSDVHKQPLTNRMRGDYSIPVKCKDIAENTVFGNAEFKLETDTSSPTITRVYSENNRINILTSEKAECVYDFNRCNFNFDDGESMTSGFSTQHDAEKISGKTYYVKCRDIWGNSESGCSMIIRP